MVQCQSTDGHHQVDRGQHKDFARQPEHIQQHAREAAQRPFTAKDRDAFLPHRLQAAGHQRHQHQAEGQREDVAVGQQRRNQEMSTTHSNAMQEDHRHGVFKHRERQRTEEQHSRQQHPANDIAVGQELVEFAHDRSRLARDQPFEIAPDRHQQFGLVEKVRQRDHAQQQQRHDRQQRVVRHRACQQQPLVGAKRLQRLQREAAGVRQHVSRVTAHQSHGSASAAAATFSPRSAFIAASIRKRIGRCATVARQRARTRAARPKPKRGGNSRGLRSWPSFQSRRSGNRDQRWRLQRQNPGGL